VAVAAVEEAAAAEVAVAAAEGAAAADVAEPRRSEACTPFEIA
jgi:hypothetical protein